MRRQNELADLQYQLKVDYFNQIKEDQANTRALWHDIRKYLNTMNELINRNDIENARNASARQPSCLTASGTSSMWVTRLSAPY